MFWLHLINNQLHNTLVCLLILLLILLHHSSCLLSLKLYQLNFILTKDNFRFCSLQLNLYFLEVHQYLLTLSVFLEDFNLILVKINLRDLRLNLLSFELLLLYILVYKCRNVVVVWIYCFTGLIIVVLYVFKLQYFLEI